VLIANHSSVNWFTAIHKSLGGFDTGTGMPENPHSMDPGDEFLCIMLNSR
jgi:hypothetical protein